MPEEAKPINVEALKALVRTVPDFPKPGIIFKDITPVLSDGKLFRMAVDCFACPLPPVPCPFRRSRRFACRPKAAATRD